MMEWLFLLLPIAALSGWLSARKKYLSHEDKNQTQWAPEYFKGLNYLLNEQPDKAIDVFIRLLEVNSETVETHFALASLFRRRGETERAIRLHQNLIARPTLTIAHREHALIELGIDYTRAGLLDRAEQLFCEIIDTNTQAPTQVYRYLLNLYQLQKQWHKAIDIATKMQAHDSQIHIEIAQMYCELAETQQDTTQDIGLSYLKKASQYDVNCVRHSLLEAHAHIAKQQYRKALAALSRIEKQDASLLTEALPLFFQCHQALSQLPQFRDWLYTLIQRYPQMTEVQLLLVDVIESVQGAAAAYDYLRQQLEQTPSLIGLDKLLTSSHYKLEQLPTIIQQLTAQLMTQAPQYLCQHCGFSGRTLHWHCPSCQQWGTIRLNRYSSTS